MPGLANVALAKPRAALNATPRLTPLPGSIAAAAARARMATSRLASTSASTAAEPPARDKLMGAWLFSTAALVFGMVVLGGATRLTRSGLSMVDWSPLGRLPPSTTEEWQREFDRYKTFPEGKQNPRMTLDEFKFIFFMEWAHRTYGRFLGLFYGLPLAYFLASGRAKAVGKTGALLALLGLGGTQGLVGWWMVKSGLKHDLPLDKEVRVSPYRLTAHLAMAVTLFSGLLWTGWSVVHPSRVAKAAINRPVSGGAHAVVALVFATMMSGGFVAGNDAGRAFNDWPLYAGNLTPEGLWKSDLGWRNITENTATVQFDHRNLAYATLATSTLLLAKSEAQAKAGNLSPAARNGVRVLAAAAWGQACLGIATLMTVVPVSLGALHQAGALTVYTTALYVMHAVRFVRP